MSGIDNNTVALLHFNDSVTKDECGNTWTVNGNITISSIQSVFGGKSLYLNRNEGTHPYLCCSNNLINNYNDFTVDFWIYYINQDTDGAYVTFYTGPTGIAIGYQGQLAFIGGSGGSTITIGGNQINKFVHFAVVRKDNIFYTFLNGIKQGQTNRVVDLGNPSVGIIYIGSNGTANSIGGYIDEFRISNIARWTADFTPPTSPYSYESKLYLDSNNAVWGMKV